MTRKENIKPATCFMALALALMLIVLGNLPPSAFLVR